MLLMYYDVIITLNRQNLSVKINFWKIKKQGENILHCDKTSTKLKYKVLKIKQKTFFFNFY